MKKFVPLIVIIALFLIGFALSKKEKTNTPSEQPATNEPAYYVCFNSDDGVDTREMQVAYNNNDEALFVQYQGLGGTFNLEKTAEIFQDDPANYTKDYNEIVDGEITGAYTISHSGDWDYGIYASKDVQKTSTFTSIPSKRNQDTPCFTPEPSTSSASEEKAIAKTTEAMCYTYTETADGYEDTRNIMITVDKSGVTGEYSGYNLSGEYSAGYTGTFSGAVDDAGQIDAQYTFSVDGDTQEKQIQLAFSGADLVEYIEVADGDEISQKTITFKESICEAE